LIKKFWEKHKDKLKPFMLKKLSSDDIIISATPRFVLEGIVDELKISSKNLICSEFSDD
jgi:hypothetical protein